MNYADYDLNSLIHDYELSIKIFKNRKQATTLNYLKELKEKIDNPTTQVIVADEYNVYIRFDTNHFKDLLNNQYGRLDVASMHPFTPKQKDHKIKKVEFNGPATIIFWNDNTKTVVKNIVPSEYDREKAILYAVVKKLTTKKEYNDILRTIDKGRTNYEWI